MTFFEKAKFFNTHYLGWIWLVGVICLCIIFALKYIERRKFDKLVKQKEQETALLKEKKKALL